MSRRTLWIGVSLAIVSQFSTGCYTLRPAYWRGGCYDAGLTPPGAGLPLLPRPLLARPILPRPFLAAGYPVSHVATPPATPAYGGDMPMGGGPGCASCYSSPVTYPVPPGQPMLASGPAFGGDFGMPVGSSGMMNDFSHSGGQPGQGNIIASTPRQTPVLNYGPQPAGFSNVPPVNFGQPSNMLPQPKVYPMNTGGTDTPTPMPMNNSNQK